MPHKCETENFPGKVRNNPAFLGRTVRLFLISFISLFLEMLIIRWLSTEARIFAHLKNFALIACFAGLGLGFSSRRFKFPLLLPLVGMAFLVLASQPKNVVGPWSLKTLSSMISYGSVYSFSPIQNWGTWCLGQVILMAVFLVIVFMFLPLGQALGELFRSSGNLLHDYIVNLIASILGILAFTLLCVLKTPPNLWFIAGLSPLLFVLPERRLVRFSGILLLLFILMVPLFLGKSRDGLLSVTWSPYQKIQVLRYEALEDQPGMRHVKPTSQPCGGYVLHTLLVNDIAMMWILDLRRETLLKYKLILPEEKIEWYDFPYRIFPHPDNVLILGSGGGNDVAAALRHGAGQVDAVEIDPVIVAQGLKYHDEKPYGDPRVTVHITDARRFLQMTSKHYDMIVFGQLDNTDYNLMSNLSNIRMDSYIYTRESFRSAFHLLKRDGIMVVNFGEGDWWGDRVTRLIFESTGAQPRGFRNEGTLFFKGNENTYLCGNISLIDEACRNDRGLARWVAMKQADWKKDADGPSITDDWPYWYLPDRAVPSLFQTVILFILVMTMLLGSVLLPETKKIEGHFFFLGAAFMLLEVHIISKMALLFGSTWMVNAAVITSILIMSAGAAVVVLYRGTVRPFWPYVLLALFLIIQWFFSPSYFLNMKQALSIVCALALYSLPIFFAGLIFAGSFTNDREPDIALGSNLLGAICGGLLESLSYIWGMNALVGISLLLYVISAVFLMMNKRS
jgi:hypothetical protein